VKYDSYNKITQGCALGLEAVSRPSRGAVVPLLSLASVEISNASGSRVGLDTEGLRLGLGSKRLGLLNRCVDRGISVSINFVICFYFFTGVGAMHFQLSLC